jgi:hypothetical protein
MDVLGFVGNASRTFAIWRTRHGFLGAPQDELSCVLLAFGVLYEACAVAMRCHEAMKLYSYPPREVHSVSKSRHECVNAPQATATEKLGIHIVSYRIRNRIYAMFSMRLQQPLPSQLNLPRSLSRFESAFAHASHATVAKLDLVFDFWKCARTVVWEVYAAERVRAKVFVAMR